MNYIYISFDGWDKRQFPIPPKRIKQVEGECRHTPMPSGYIARMNWAKACGKTHRQVKCPNCGLYVVWVRKVKRKAEVCG